MGWIIYPSPQNVAAVVNWKLLWHVCPACSSPKAFGKAPLQTVVIWGHMHVVGLCRVMWWSGCCSLWFPRTGTVYHSHGIASRAFSFSLCLLQNQEHSSTHPWEYSQVWSEGPGTGEVNPSLKTPTFLRSSDVVVCNSDLWAQTPGTWARVCPGAILLNISQHVLKMWEWDASSTHCRVAESRGKQTANSLAVGTIPQSAHGELSNATTWCWKPQDATWSGKVKNSAPRHNLLTPETEDKTQPATGKEMRFQWNAATRACFSAASHRFGKRKPSGHISGWC